MGEISGEFLREKPAVFLLAEVGVVAKVEEEIEAKLTKQESRMSGGFLDGQESGSKSSL